MNPVNMIGGFKVLQKIGSGSMGDVYKAMQVSMDRIVALKILPPILAKDRIFCEQFIKEARATAKLSHKNIIQGIDVGKTEKGIFYFAMEFIDGSSLLDILKKKGPFPEEEAINIIIQISKALEHANENNFVHRDIKPSNIMLTSEGVAKLCDLGLATNKNIGSAEQATPVGTPYYISPEQAKDEEFIDIRSDIYSLGITLYHLVTGKVPFGGSPTIVMSKHLINPIPPPKKINPNLSDAICNLILKMTEKEKEKRYQNPSELIEALIKVKEGDYEEVKEEFSNENNEIKKIDLKQLGKKLQRKKLRRRRF